MKNLLIILFIFTYSRVIYSQTYSENREKFVKILMDQLSDIKTSEPRDFVKKELQPLLVETTDFPDDQFKKMIEICNLMETKKQSVYPEIYNYVYSMYSIVVKKQSLKSYRAWHSSLEQLLNSKNINRFKDFIELSANFFSNSVIAETPNHAWYYDGGNFAFDVTDKPIIKFDNGKLICLVKNTLESTKKEKPFHDSIVVEGSKGVYDPFLKKYIGRGGKIFWEKVGLNREISNATLFSYEIPMKSTNLSCDSVLLVTPYFSKPIYGKLTDRAFVITREMDKTFPYFVSFDKRLTIKNIKEGVDYEGGFSLQGASFIGVGTVKDPAKVYIYKDGKKFVRLSCLNVSIDPKKIIAPASSLAIYIGQKDSISHPGLDINYNIEHNSLDFSRGKIGTSSAPFSSSYHSLDMYVPKIVWKKGVEELMFTYDFGISQEQRIAKFESKNMFDGKLYERLNSMEKVHPLVSIADYCNQNGETILNEGKLASALNKTIEQAKQIMLELNSLGFINYDIESKVIIVNPKLFNFVQARADQVDYDNLIFISDMRPKKIEEKTEEEIERDDNLKRLDKLYKEHNENRRTLTNFGTMSFSTLELNLDAVDIVSLSEVQKMVVFPKNAKVSISKDRNFKFSGWLNAGKMEVNTLDAEYVYADNKVKLTKTSSSLFKVIPLKNEDGDRPIQMASAISGIEGELFVDDPTNRSGKNKKITDFPKISVSNKVKVYYAQKSLFKGAYDSARFYFEVYPFLMDSLDNFKEKAFRLKGELNSAGIFPIIKQDLKIMPDYSFGFVQEAPQGGYDFYGTGAKYENKIVLSNNGLQGSGKIDFIKSTSISKSLTFLPDSTVGYAVFENKPIETGIQYPDVKSQKAYICYLPKGNKLKAYSTDVPLSFFNDEAKLDGIAVVAPSGMTGNGTMNFAVASLGSRLFNFTRWDMNSDTSFFNILNKTAIDNDREEKYSLTTDNIKSHISFKDRVGNFTSNAGKTIVSFPVNQYDCTMDKFDWFMDKDLVDLRTNDQNLVASSDENLISNMFSNNQRQDSLQFRSSKANFDLKNNILSSLDTKYIDVADARIYPDSGKVVIHKKAKMDPLDKSKIIANRTTRFHKFLNSNVVISSRNSFSARGEYPYYDSDEKLTMIKMESINVDSIFQTVAFGKINEVDTFKLSANFDFYGGVKINASNPLLSFKGSTRIRHNCTKFSRGWMAFQSELDPKNIQIPVSETMKTMDSKSISAGILWRDSPSQDSIKMYPTFLSPMISENDPNVISAFGYLQFNKDSSQFQIASKEKFADFTTPGNFVALNTKACSLTGIGKVNLGMDYGDIAVQAYGTVKYDQETSKTTMDLSLRYDMPIDKSVMDVAVDKITLEESASPIDISSTLLFDAFAAWSDIKSAQKSKEAYLEKSELKKLPSELDNSIVLTGVKLTSFESKKNQDRGLISFGDGAGVVSVYGKPVNKSFPIKMTFSQAYSENVNGDRFCLYLNAAVSKDYFFEFTMTKKDGEMRVFSEDDDFSSKLSALKSDKRKYKNFVYEYTDNRVFISKFLKLFNTN
jgi:hypothetical protein